MPRRPCEPTTTKEYGTGGGTEFFFTQYQQPPGEGIRGDGEQPRDIFRGCAPFNESEGNIIG